MEKGFDEITDFGKFAKDFVSASYSPYYGLATKDAQLKAFDEIIDYFISRIKNVDLCRDKRGITALNYAAEFDDVETCRKLIKAGADTRKVIGFAPAFGDSQGNTVFMPISFIFRLIYYKSWKTLRMFLTEFKEKAEKVMHCGDFEITPLVAFIVHMKTEIAKGRFSNITQMDEKIRIAEEFKQLFLAAGASMTESTALGTAEQLLHA